MKKIILRVKGGLGNQLFQYAAGRYLADRFNLELFFDLTSLNLPALRYTKRSFELNNFRISGSKLPTVKALAYRAAIALPQAFGSQIFKCTDADDLALTDKVSCKDTYYLTGYWQTYRYADAISDDLVRHLIPRSTLDAESIALIRSARESNSVCLHVRRGDYVTLPSANKHHGVLSLDYYNQAIRYISNRQEKPNFFVFSDDIDWCMAHLNLAEFKVRFVNHNSGSNSWRDLVCMANCKSLVIANSSFSWWAAWLSMRSGYQATVIAPRQWYRNQAASSDFFPKKWLLI